MNKHFAVAIDGPAGAGKSTVAKMVAASLNAVYLDTGAMYRAVGLYMLRNGIDPADARAVADHAGEAVVDVAYVDGTQRVFLCGEDVTSLIRENAVSAAASHVSAVPQVRSALVARQQEIAREQDVVMDGRDIGTKVLPDAQLKIFLTASSEIRARRRYLELIEKGQAADYDRVLQEIRERDYNDAHRAASPMIQAEDAYLLDSGALTAQQVADKITAMALARRKEQA